MKISRLALSAMIASACLGGTAFGQSNRTAPRYYPASYYSYSQEGAATQAPAPITSASDDKGAKAAPATETAPASTPAAAAPASAKPSSSACSCADPACDVAAICDGKSSCDSLGCGSGCGCGNGSGGGLLGGGLLGCGLGGDLGEPFKLFGDGICGITIGGWTSVGYHDKSTNFNFNNYDSRVQLGQQWFFAEKIADGSEGIGFGGRIDYVYGTDAPDTQAFGIPNNHWDNSWDNPAGSNLGYGHALPQVYGEVAMGDLSVKVGKFFTIVGNEVVQSTGNFFYSRQFTFYNAEPFTHTGALSTFNVDEDTQLYNGYVMGWDSGFEDNGDAYIGGFKRKMNDSLSILYTTVLGRMGDGNRAVQERGDVHNVIITANLTEKLTYINQIDWLYSRNNLGQTQRNTVGNIHYLIYQATERVALGQRFEWFNFSGNNFNNARNDDMFNYTLGVNYKQNANLTLRPEVRWVWDPTRFGFNENAASAQVAAGGDIVFTF